MTELENNNGISPSLAGMHLLKGLRQATILHRRFAGSYKKSARETL